MRICATTACWCLPTAAPRRPRPRTTRRSPTCARSVKSRPARLSKHGSTGERRFSSRSQLHGDIMEKTSKRLKAHLQQGAVLAPGVFDALSALVAEQAGFEALYLSGASIAYTRLGRSDVGLTTFTEVEDTLARIAERVDLPVIVDAD